MLLPGRTGSFSQPLPLLGTITTELVTLTLTVVEIVASSIHHGLPAAGVPGSLVLILAKRALAGAL